MNKFMRIAIVLLLLFFGASQSDVARVWHALGGNDTKVVTQIDRKASDAAKKLETAASLPSSVQGGEAEAKSGTSPVSLKDVPPYTGTPFVKIDRNRPAFTEKDKARGPFEEYSPLDELGRCGPAFAKIGVETMPTEPRGPIGSVRPTGWHTYKYEHIQGKYLYNRCHLIGFQLAGENANPLNLITGTRYLNVDGMLPFENEVTNYVKKTNHHVLYRVTPIFKGKDLVARGVQMEALSLEDNGKVHFNVFVYNVQPGVTLNYANGTSHAK